MIVGQAIKLSAKRGPLNVFLLAAKKAGGDFQKGSDGRGASNQRPGAQKLEGGFDFLCFSLMVEKGQGVLHDVGLGLPVGIPPQLAFFPDEVRADERDVH